MSELILKQYTLLALDQCIAKELFSHSEIEAIHLLKQNLIFATEGKDIINVIIQIVQAVDILPEYLNKIKENEYRFGDKASENSKKT